MPSSLIGRDHPAGVLRAEIDHLLDSHGGLVLVAGEGGIGKSTLVADAAADAERRGARVLSGSCSEGDGAPGYWPWVQVVRGLARVAGTGEWSAAAAAAGDRLPVLLGETTTPAGPASAEDTAFRTLDAFTTLLVTAARSRPLVVVLDDLHRADPASLRLLDFVVRHAWFERVLVIGTYRDVEVEAPGHPARPLLLPLLSRATTVRLTGLDVAGVGALVARTTGTAPADDVAAQVHRRTGGNPFFVEQAARLGPDAALAAGIRDAVQRRLDLLPAPVVELLGAAAVIGHEFDGDLLAAVTATPRDTVDALLEPAVATRLILRDDGRLAFAHDIVRERLYADRPESGRRDLHAAAVRALVTASGPRAGAATLAHHARLAVPRLPASEAVEHLLAAARDARGRLAAEEAVRHLRSALVLTGPAARPALEIELATELDRAGELDAAREQFAAVVEGSRSRGDAELFARAALGSQRLGNPDPATRLEIELMDEARERLDDDPAADPALLAQVLAAASMARTHVALDEEGARALSEQAVALARGLDAAARDRTLGWCLLALHDAVWEPGTAVTRIEVLDELTAVARRASDRELESLAAFLRTIALLELGEPRYQDEFAVFEALTERTRLPRHRFLAVSRRGGFDTLAGRFDDARARLDDALALGEHVGEVDRGPMWRDQVWALELLRGNPAAAEAVARTSTPGDPFVEFLEAFTAAGSDDHDRVLRRLDRVEALVRSMPRRFASMWTVFRAQLAATTGDAELCERARADLAPLLDQWAVFSGGGVVWGPMVFWAARVDAAQARWSDAVTGFTAAAHAADRLGAGPWWVLATTHLARALLARGEPDDPSAAATARAAAAAEARRLGMVVALDAPPEKAAAGGNVFRVDGEVWTLRFAGRTVHMRDAKGLHDLRNLLGRAGVDVPAAELLDPGADAVVAATRRLGADPMIDDEARDAYRHRLRTLDEQIREALDSGADRRAATLDRERETLLDELRRTTGLGGRSRRLGDATERARQTVTARIRDTLRRLRKVHPELAEHLAATVSTGARCRYQPPEPTIWAR